MSTLYIWEAANLFCGDHDPTNSKHLTIQNLKLPALEAKYQEHHPGGGLVEIDIEVGVAKLEASFKLVGDDPALMSQFGLSSRIKHVYTAYSTVRDRRTGRAIERKSIMEARLGKIEPDEFQRGELYANEYALREITSYAVYWDGREKMYWDFWTNVWRVDAVDQNGDINRIGRVPNSGI